MPNRASESLDSRAIKATLEFLIALAVLIFLSAGSLRYWQGWIFWVHFSAWVGAVTLYFLKHDPALVERRLRAGPGAERKASQKPIQLAAAIIFAATFVGSALDYRFGWSQVPVWVVAAGNILIAAGFLGVFAVFRENTFASAIIEVAVDQKVISTGPYAIVRHPMYAAALLLFLGMPLALGSWWGMLAIVPLTAILAVRLLDEETYLARNLPGYETYRAEVRYRLVPGLW